MDLWIPLLLAFLALFIVLYNVSTSFHYYVRIGFFNFTILIHGAEVCITMIPSYLQNKGADYVLNSFYYWCKWTGIQTHVIGYENVRIDGPAVVVCNHQSSLDVMSMGSCFPKKCVCMMKKVLAYVPFFNLGAFWAQTIFIDRHNKEKAMHSVDYCVSAMKAQGLKIWVFPEGTRNRSGGMKEFKKGAFNIAVRAQIPIIPVVVSDYRGFYSKSEKYFRNDGEVVISALKPILTEGLTLEDVPELANKVRSLMLVEYEKVSEEANRLMSLRRSKKLD